MSWTFFYNINNLPGKCEKLCEITLLNFVCKILQRMDMECRHLWLWKIKGLVLRQVYAISIQHVRHIKIWRKNSEGHKKYQNKMRKKMCCERQEATSRKKWLWESVFILFQWFLQNVLHLYRKGWFQYLLILPLPSRTSKLKLFLPFPWSLATKIITNSILVF